MDANVIARFLISGFSLLGIIFTLLFLVSDYRLDDYRESLFELREELFDIAAASDVGFAHPAYLILNLRIKSLLLYAHRTKFIMFLLYAVFVRTNSEADDSGEKSLSATLGGLRHDQKEVVMILSNRVDEILIRRVIFLPLLHEALEDPRATQAANLASPRPFIVKAVEHQAMRVYDFARPA
ncbi:MAG TPA: hypothetical protein VGD64_08710 [Acidisarcina sp.]